MEYLAHSPKDGIPSQSYKEHVVKVCEKALDNAKRAASFAVFDGELLQSVVEASACIHDLGKLHEENQRVLHRLDGGNHLPINHVDAGVVALRKCGDYFSHEELMVYSHHRGLPNITEEENREEDIFRSKEMKDRKLVDDKVFELLQIHKEILPQYIPHQHEETIRGDFGVFERMALSCLADADHTDTAMHYKKYPIDEKEVPLMAEQRLMRLDKYVKSLRKRDDNSERNRLRSEMYKFCRDVNISKNIVACDSPVGSGKTTAVMAHLLQQAVCRNSRRIFIVLPYTNIIQQSVEVYRKALCFPGEEEERVVAELHHRADFESDEARALTAQWRAPIIVTTAVAFFETLAACRPSSLRR